MVNFDYYEPKVRQTTPGLYGLAIVHDLGNPSSITVNIIDSNGELISSLEEFYLYKCVIEMAYREIHHFPVTDNLFHQLTHHLRRILSDGEYDYKFNGNITIKQISHTVVAERESVRIINV